MIYYTSFWGHYKDFVYKTLRLLDYRNRYIISTRKNTLQQQETEDSPPLFVRSYVLSIKHLAQRPSSPSGNRFGNNTGAQEATAFTQRVRTPWDNCPTTPGWTLLPYQYVFYRQAPNNTQPARYLHLHWWLNLSQTSNNPSATSPAWHRFQ